MSESADGGVTPRGLLFPTAHVLIAMGPSGEPFRDSLLQALLDAGARRTATAIEFRLSRTGRYQSVHIEVQVDTREELEALYLVVKAHPDVVYRL